MFKDSNIFIFTHQFPYGQDESFIVNELAFHSKTFSAVKIFPLKKDGSERKVDGNVSVVNLFEAEKYNPLKLLVRNFFLFNKIFIYEFYKSDSKISFLKLLPRLKSALLQGFYRADLLKKYLKTESSSKNILLYSFWTDEWVTVLSILKEKKIIDKFVSRIHGYDLYKERRKYDIIPFRSFQFKNGFKIFAVSNAGLSYLRFNYPGYSEKFYLNHLTASDRGNGYFDPGKLFTIVSCSMIISLKRVHLIPEILKKIDFPIRWVHFGDGGEQFDMLKAKCNEFTENVSVDLKGHISNDKIIEFYKTNSVNLFLHLSESEGGAPVALQEAASFGIPLLGTNAGGIPEIVTEETGILIPVNFNIDEVADLINNFRDSYRNTVEFRSKVRAFWSKNFNAEINYNKLCDEIININ